MSQIVLTKTTSNGSSLLWHCGIWGGGCVDAWRRGCGVLVCVLCMYVCVVCPVGWFRSSRDTGSTICLHSPAPAAAKTRDSQGKSFITK